RTAVPFLRLACTLYTREGDPRSLSECLHNLSAALRHSGSLHAAEAAALDALILARQSKEPYWETGPLSRLGRALVARGLGEKASSVWERARRIYIATSNRQGEGRVCQYLSELAIRRGDPASAVSLALRASGIADIKHHEYDIIRSSRLR